MIALREMECCALAGTDCRPTPLRRPTGRPQLKRDPLGSHGLHSSLSCHRSVIPSLATCHHRPVVLTTRTEVRHGYRSPTRPTVSHPYVEPRCHLAPSASSACAVGPRPDPSQYGS